jgi:hypothetical protein
VAAGEQVARHGDADLLVREAHQHVDRRRRHVPGFDHGNARRDEALPHLRRVVDAGQVDGVGAAAQHCRQKRLLARRGVARQTEEHLVAGLPQAVGQRLHSVDEDRVGDRRDDGGHEPRALGGESAGEQVRHVARAVDDLLHVGEGVGRDELGTIDDA